MFGRYQHRQERFRLGCTLTASCLAKTKTGPYVAAGMSPPLTRGYAVEVTERLFALFHQTDGLDKVAQILRFPCWCLWMRAGTALGCFSPIGSISAR